MIHEALRLIRQWHDLKAGELAKELGISGSHLSLIESGKKRATIKLIKKYSEVLEIPISAIEGLSYVLIDELTFAKKDRASKLELMQKFLDLAIHVSIPKDIGLSS